MAAAHQLNAAHIKELKDKLSEAEDNIRLAIQRKETVELHNAVLEPELKEKSELYNKLVSQLNTTMADKAEVQILLNEKQDQLAATRKKIALVESEMLHLDKTMDMGRKEASRETESLESYIATNKVKVQETRMENAAMRKKIAKLKSSLVESNNTVLSKKQLANGAEASQNEMLQLEESLKKKEEDARLHVARLTNGTTAKCMHCSLSAEILSEHENMRLEFGKKKQELIDLQTSLREELKVALTESSRIAHIRKEVKAEFRTAKEEGDREASILASIQERVTTSRGELVRQADECIRLKHESNQLDFQRTQAEEIHQTNVSLLNEQIKSTRDMVTKERAEKQRIQVEQSEVVAAHHSLKRQHDQILAQTTQRISSAVREQGDLKLKSWSLGQQLDEGNQNVSRLTVEIAEASIQFETMKNTLEKEIETLESSVAALTTKNEALLKRLSETQPQLKTWQADCEEQTSYYESKKKIVVGLKNKKNGLQESIMRAGREIEKLNVPHERFKADIGRQRVDVILVMKSHVTESRDIEQDIQQLQAKLDAVERANTSLTNDKVVNMLLKCTSSHC
ncbi:myosin-9-like [Corticium candelabrum]|uniref:myosin-9-like n=1 Tax=Corticium candelabrum TaxID=121492 RepID=UPI002E273275|nr:myosin-9-like [Corticium candelabrum]